MLSDLFGLLGAAALAVTGIPAAPGKALFVMQLCHGGTIPLNIPVGDEHGPGKSCPGGCHAGCLSRKGHGDGDPED